MQCSNEHILEIVKEVINPKAVNDIGVDLTVIENIIYKKIPSSMRNNAPLSFPDLFFSFTEEYEHFKEFLLFEPLIGKRIVALGGGFSSGKSTFLNSVMNRKIEGSDGKGKAANLLPSAIDPSTSVPTYIVNSQKEEAFGINMFNSKIRIGIDDIKPIAHGFGRDEDDETDTTGIKLGHILKTIFAETPFQTFENIAFLDTPGYSKPDTTEYTDRTDEKIAREQLNSADCIIWFISATKGTFPEDDIRFLESLENKDIPMLIVINKADRQTDDNLKSIVSTVKSLAKQRRISCVDVLTFSRKRGTEDRYDRAKILKVLESWNKPVTQSNFAYNFGLLFIKCRDYFLKEQADEKQRLSKINNALLLTENDEALEFMSQLKVQSAERIKELEKILNELMTLRGEFFTELRRLASVIGIDLPEANEVELAYKKNRETGSSPLKCAERLCKEKKVEVSNRLFDIITNQMNEVKTGSFSSNIQQNEAMIFDTVSKKMKDAESEFSDETKTEKSRIKISESLSDGITYDDEIEKFYRTIGNYFTRRKANENNI